MRAVFDSVRREAMLDMRRYTQEIVQKCGIGKEKKMHVPIGEKITREEAEKDETLEKECQQRVGALTWAMCTGRPDIGFSVSHASQHIATAGCMRVTSECLRYLKIPQILTFSKTNEQYKDAAEITTAIHTPTPARNNNDNVKHIVYSDSDFATHFDRRSIAGTAETFGANLSAWRSSKIGNISTCPHDAEMSAGSASCKSGLATKNILESYKFFKQIYSNSELLLDSKSNVMGNASAEITRRSKHVEVGDAFMRCCHQNGRMPTRHIPRKINIADGWTHELQAVAHAQWRKAIGMQQAGDQE